MPNINEDLITRLQTAAIECRDLIREMHGAQKSLKAEIKDAQQAMENMRIAIRLFCAEAINERVDRELDRLVPKIRDQVDRSVVGITRQFDQITAPMVESMEFMSETLRTSIQEVTQIGADHIEAKAQQAIKVIGEYSMARVTSSIQESLDQVITAIEKAHEGWHEKD